MRPGSAWPKLPKKEGLVRNGKRDNARVGKGKRKEEKEERKEVERGKEGGERNNAGSTCPSRIIHEIDHSEVKRFPSKHGCLPSFGPFADLRQENTRINKQTQNKFDISIAKVNYFYTLINTESIFAYRWIYSSLSSFLLTNLYCNFSLLFTECFAIIRVHFRGPKKDFKNTKMSSFHSGGFLI